MARNSPALTDEVVLLIFEQVAQVAPQSLLNLCLACHRFCRLATTVLYRSVSLDATSLSRSNPAHPGSSWYSYKANIMAHSRYIAVEEALDWHIITSVLSKMKRLESIRWSSWEEPFPKIIIGILQERWPDANVHIEDLPVGHRTDDEDVRRHDMELLKSLVGFQSVRSIKTVINYEHPVAIRWLKDVILSCPRLNVLHLRVPRDWQGQPNWRPDGLGSYDLSVEPGEKLGPLTELVYESRHSFSPPMIPVSFFDWTRLRRLELRGHDIYHFIKSL